MREVAAEERAELGLTWDQPLDPYLLAKTHGIRVYPVDELPDCEGAERAVRHFTARRTDTWSAALVPVGHRRLIIENTSHAPVRRRSSIAHELGHFLLEHVFDEVLLTAEGCRRFDREKEKQATFVSGELLVPWKGAVEAALADMTNAQVAQTYGVSEQFAQMRMSGARVVARNIRAKKGTRGKAG
ncbi:ImmA/IrrE family metallo-endopeptidase [Lentzea sp. HUAS TT2]|uniref:ImmA/IrrE family metallo-endopeptidase n=1 Tax=Lentzea sp. HUAS TT2 TaxID=3447454 RepID=UPI003F7303D3